MHILITGAAGDVGTRLRRLLKGTYSPIRVGDIRKPADLRGDEEFIAADLADYSQVEKITAGIHGIVRLGGYSGQGPGTPFTDPTSLAATIFSRPHIARVSNALCLRLPIMPSASIRATRKLGWR